MPPILVSLHIRLALAAVAVLIAAAPVAAAPEGQITWGVHTTLVPSYFDPAETTIGTSFMVLYGSTTRL